MTFYNVYKTYDWNSIKQQIDETTAEDVLISLAKSKKDLQDFMHLISPAAQSFLEQMAQMSQKH